MADKTESRQENFPSMGIKEVVIRTGTDVEAGAATLVMTLADYGMNRVIAVWGMVHTTDYDIMVQDAGSTAVASGDLTITVAGGNENKRRVYIVWGD